MRRLLRMFLALGSAVVLLTPAAAQEITPATPAPIAEAPAQVTPAPPGLDPSGYAVGPTDTLRVTTFNEPELSGSFRIDADGTITFPLLGRVRVAGQTVQQIEQALTQLLRDGYVRRAQVSVEIENFRSRSIFILGEVRTPGKYPLQGNVTLLEVLALAGSPTDAAGAEVVVLRPQGTVTVGAPALPEDGQSAEVTRVNLIDLQQGRLATNVFLQDGDTVFVPAAARFYVTGHVRNPGSFVVPRDGITVQQAIALAGGLTERGSNRGIKIRREVKPGEFEEIKVELTDKVQPNDTVIIRQRYL
ncbi:MAG: polysaccharide biosynthesis/export family protein [Vicinamibacterales bacterium]